MRLGARPHSATAIALLVGALAMLSPLVGCSRRPAEDAEAAARTSLSDGWLAMGTFFEADLRVKADERSAAQAWLDHARAELVRLESITSRHDSTAQVSLLNRALASKAVVEEGARVGSVLESVLIDAVGVWRATGGAFDVTVGPLVELWRRAAERDEWPSVDAIQKAKRRVGSDRLLLAGDGRVSVSVPRVRIDLDAVSKGAALDELARSLASSLPGVPALLSLGQSSTVAIGDPDGGGWILAVQSTAPEGGEVARLRLRDRAVSVSSSLGSTSRIAGQTVSHIIDPRTGATVDGTVEAVVVGDRALQADGWSTGLLVLGAHRRSIRLVEQAGFAAFVFDSAGRSIHTSSWESYLAPSATPTSARRTERGVRRGSGAEAEIARGRFGR